MSRFLPPEPLTEAHDLGDFSCGEASLDDWLKRRARANQASGASRTYVVCEDNRVVGYYALASGVVLVENAPGRFRRNMPNPIPVAVLARLAVDRECQGQGIGRALFRDAARRVTHGRRCDRHPRDRGSRNLRGGQRLLSCAWLRPESARTNDAHGNARRRPSCSPMRIRFAADRDS